MAGNDLIRMSGMNSGLDTESIIKALTANSKLKITKQERNVMKYEETQKQYREVISKMTELKDKYFNLLNNEKNLTGSSMWNKYASKTYVNGQEQVMAGVSITTSINSNQGEYKVKVNKTATQASLKGSSLSESARIASSELDSMQEGQQYGITITVGDEAKNITFEGGADRAGTLKNINDALSDAFGDSNESASAGSSKGLVYIDDTGKFISRNGKGLSVSGAGAMEESKVIDFTSAGKGNNSFTFQVGGETLNVSFQTISRDQFSDLFNEGIQDMSEDEANEYISSHYPMTDGSGDVNTANVEMQSKLREQHSLYTSIKNDYVESVKYDAYKSWSNTEGMSEDELAAHNAVADTLKENAYTKAENENREKWVGKWLGEDNTVKMAYDAYANAEKKTQAAAALNANTEVRAKYDAYVDAQNAAGEEVQDIVDWAKGGDDVEVFSAWQKADKEADVDSIYEWSQNSSDENVSAKFTEFTNKYDGTTESESELLEKYGTYLENSVSAETLEKYNAYKENNPGVSLYDWANSSDGEATDEEKAALKDYDTWKADHIENESWHLKRSTWELITYNEYEAFKDAGMADSAVAANPVDTEKIFDHYNKSTLNNTIGQLETSDGVKFSVSYDDATNQATITAEDSSGAPVSFSMSAASSNATAFSNVSASTVSISQISNSTKISDLGIAADENGNYNVTINNKSFTFEGSMTVKDMMKQINGSDAGVKMSYSSLNNSFSIVANEYGTGSKVDISSDAQGLFEGLGLTASSGAVATAGTNLEVTINGRDYESNGNSIEADGTTFSFSSISEGADFTASIDKDTSGIADTLKDFIKDYNALIKDVFAKLDEKPESKYYFLTDADKEDLELSDKQEEKWEEKSKLGLLYHDSAITNVMNKLRTSLMGTVTDANGNDFGLASMGIVTATDYKQHGTLVIKDENKFLDAIANHADDIAKLFSDTEKGIMKAFSDNLDSAVKATGDKKGILVQKAGLSTGTSATSNQLYDMIKRTKTKIASLTKRYEGQQDRLWKRYSSMESLMGEMNSQQSSLMSYFG